MSNSSLSYSVNIATVHFGVQHKIRNPFVMIIGVTTYKGKKSNGWPYLPGVKKDISHMKHLWRNVLKFDTKILSERYPKCSRNNILDFRTECQQSIINQSNEKRYDALICFVSGHGRQDTLISGDGEKINIMSNLMHDFDADHVRILANFPKIFVFDTCRGIRNPQIRNTMINTKPETRCRGNENEEWISLNLKTGFRIMYATTPGTKTLETDEGGQFTSAFYEIMITLYCSNMLQDTDFQTILQSASQKAKCRSGNVSCPIQEDSTNCKIFIKRKYANFDGLKGKCDCKICSKLYPIQRGALNFSTYSLRQVNKIKTKKEQQRRAEFKMDEKYDDIKLDEVGIWLVNDVELDLEECYEVWQVFQKQNINTLSRVKELDKDTLIELGIKIGPRNEIMRHISQLNRKESICCSLNRCRMSICGADVAQSADMADDRCFLSCVVL
eukprot:150127_1